MQQDVLDGSTAMDWSRYAELCDRGDVVSRWLLEQTAGLLEETGEEALGRRLRVALEGAPLPRPPEHRGGSATEFLTPGCTLDEVRLIATCVDGLAREKGRTLPSGRHLRGVREAWDEYRDWLDGSHPRSPVRA